MPFMTEEQIQEDARHVFETRLAILNADDPEKEATEAQRKIARQEAKAHAHELRVRNGLVEARMPNARS